MAGGARGKKQAAKTGIPAKGVARPRAAKKDPYTDEGLLFSSKSKLIDMDLHAYFANPKAWEVLEEEEKDMIRSLLPAHLALNDDGSIPQSFLKYDTDWRNALRQFQEGLACGYFDPEWQRQAAEAMEERAAGKFDDWKEAEFEEFWGQKQKLSHDVLAGDMAKLKLEEMVKNNVFKVGDVWSYGRVFRKGNDRIHVEKDVMITAIDGSKLVVAIPPGYRKYLVASKLSSSKDHAKDDKELGTTVEDTNMMEDAAVVGGEMLTDSGSAQTQHAIDDGIAKMDVDTGDTILVGGTAGKSDQGKEKAGQRRASSSSLSSLSSLASLASLAPPASPASLASLPSPLVTSPDDPVSYTLTSLQSLETKILEVDGRIKNPGNGNSWKAMRAKRDNQDMGTLWEMREEYYVRNYS